MNQNKPLHVMEQFVTDSIMISGIKLPVAVSYGPRGKQWLRPYKRHKNIVIYYNMQYPQSFLT